jgi:hypothetical protein
MKTALFGVALVVLVAIIALAILGRDSERENEEVKVMAHVVAIPKAKMNESDTSGVPLTADASVTAPSELEQVSVPEVLEAPLRAVAAEVAKCPLDAKANAPYTAHISFRPSPTGHYEEVEVNIVPAQPFLQACLEDVFDQMQFVPSGHENFEKATWTYDFVPQKRKSGVK